MLKLYGVIRSRASRIVWLCHEIGLDFQQIPVIQAYRTGNIDSPDGPLNTRSPEFIAMSPEGAIPVIDDGGLILSQSMACTLHIARKYGADLGGSTEAEQALITQWSFYAATEIEPDALTILFLHKPGQEQSGEDQALIANAAERLIRPLTVVENHLATHGHLVGDRFTVADLNLAEVIRYAQGYGPVMSAYPAIRSWLEGCQARPAFQRMWKQRQAEPE